MQKHQSKREGYSRPARSRGARSGQMDRGGAPSAFIKGPAEAERGGVRQTVSISQRRLESPGLRVAPRPSPRPGACCAPPSRPARPATGPSAAGSRAPGHPGLRGHEGQRGGERGGAGPPEASHPQPAPPPRAAPSAVRPRLLSRPPPAPRGSPASTGERQPRTRRTRRTRQPRVRLRPGSGAAPPPPFGCPSSTLCRPHAGLGSVL